MKSMKKRRALVVIVLVIVIVIALPISITSTITKTSKTSNEMAGRASRPGEPRGVMAYSV